MPVWSNTTFVRCALVPAEGFPILFEHPNSMHLFAEIDAHVRPMHAWSSPTTSASIRRSSLERR
jgi:hypothetical protein